MPVISALRERNEVIFFRIMGQTLQSQLVLYMKAGVILHLTKDKFSLDCDFGWWLYSAYRHDSKAFSNQS